MFARLYFSCVITISISYATDQCFPENVLFGVATSAYQIEGGWNEDGKGDNMWDWFSHNYPNKIDDESNGDVACDSYHKYAEDIQYLKDLGVQFYRLSLAWSRILPNGTIDNVNEKGIEYYLNIFKLLKESNIEPVVTLYHFDLPQHLNDLGGWTNPVLVEYFGDFAQLCYDRFGSYVKYWITINEPSTTCLAGYGIGTHAPGYKTASSGIFLCIYTHAKAHAKAYHIYDTEFRKKQGGKVSLSLASSWLIPRNSSDVEATEIAMQYELGIWAHPIYKGDWPQIVKERDTERSNILELPRNRLPRFTEEEINYINGTYDFFALNYYISSLTYGLYNLTDLPNVDSYLVDRGYFTEARNTWQQSLGSTWLYNVPFGLRKLMKWIHDNYNQPDIFITENGWSDNGSTLNDTERITYLQGHLCNTYASINDDGVSVIGHTQWSALDNYEWSGGYTAKFGLISVNFTDPDRKRTPKQSYYWYKDFVETKCLNSTECTPLLNEY